MIPDPGKLRKMTALEREKFLAVHNGWFCSGAGSDFLELADAMTENAAGTFPVPVGILPEILVNGKKYTVPMATEEPSVVAAASFAAMLAGRHGGFTAAAASPVMTEQVFLRNAGGKELDKAKKIKSELAGYINPDLAGMAKRGGGLEDIDFILLKDEAVLKVELHVNVCDALGANLLNTIGEKAGNYLAQKLDCPLLMAIISNSAERRICTASFGIPVSALARNGKSGQDNAEAIVLACRLAASDPERAVTHNKGIMNGISALALAAGNDTRALESAVHYHASLCGKYKGLSSFAVNNDILEGRISLPLALSIKGGATGFHPCAEDNIRLTDVKDSAEFSCLAASLGLAQNFAALFALVSEGIQKGHMALHVKKQQRKFSRK